MHEPHDLEDDSLTNWQPVQLQYCKMMQYSVLFFSGVSPGWPESQKKPLEIIGVVFLQAGCPTNSVKPLKGIQALTPFIYNHTLLYLFLIRHVLCAGTTLPVP